MSIRLMKTIALALLAFAAADLLVPGLCDSDAPELEAMHAQAASSSHFESVPNAQGPSDDCFCCCAHIVPGIAQTQDRVDDNVFLLAGRAALRPPVQAALHEHPPRV